MTTITKSAATATAATTAADRSPVLAVIGAAVLGLGIVIVAGHVQAHPLHGAAHDMRHAAGFPCH